MNRKLLDFLCCPSCHNELQVTALTDLVKGRGSSNGCCITEGLLQCSSRHVYPVIEGVPRLLDDGLSAFPEFVRSYGQNIRSALSVEDIELTPSCSKRDDYSYIRESFSKEWGLFDYDVDKTWGWTLSERKNVFLGDVAFSKSELRGKRFLDAGCGNGSLTAALSTFGMEVVGIDLNDRLGAAQRNRGRYAGDYADNVHFVQANLFTAPLKPGSFDLIYCSGVIHHTPNSKATFARLVPFVKRGGRLYVWVYGKRGISVRAFEESGRMLKRFMSLESLLLACKVLAPFYKIGTELLNAFGMMAFRSRSTREVTLDLFDAFAPQYNHWHTQEEVQDWFRELGFTNINVSGRQKHGFGVYGDKD